MCILKEANPTDKSPAFYNRAGIAVAKAMRIKAKPETKTCPSFPLQVSPVQTLRDRLFLLASNHQDQTGSPFASCPLPWNALPFWLIG
jgi:hypothetical protein